MKTDSALGKPLSVICAAVYICSVLTAELSVGVKLSAAFCAAALSAIIIILRRVGRLSNLLTASKYPLRLKSRRWGTALNITDIILHGFTPKDGEVPSQLHSLCRTAAVR